MFLYMLKFLVLVLILLEVLMYNTTSEFLERLWIIYFSSCMCLYLKMNKVVFVVVSLCTYSRTVYACYQELFDLRYAEECCHGTNNCTS